MSEIKVRRTKCSIEGCEGHGEKGENNTIVFKRGFCTKHYYKFKNFNDVNYPDKITPTSCSINGCEGNGVEKKDGTWLFRLGLCEKHYIRQRVHGSTDLPPKEWTVCRVEGCTNKPEIGKNGEPLLSLGYCRPHYIRQYHHDSDPNIPERIVHTCCKIEGCKKRGAIDNNKEIFVLGYCASHRARFKKYGDPLEIRSIFGEDRSKNELYNVFFKIKSRCYNEKDKAYKNYGGRGIKMSEEFLGHQGFNNFCDCLGGKPSENYSVDRINNNGDYAPGNIKWSNRHQQSKNRRSNNEFVGVSWDKSKNRWLAQICINRKHIYLGLYVNYLDACAARRAAEIKYNIYNENLN